MRRDYELADEALKSYSLRAVRIRLLARTHNITFRIDDVRGQRFVLKIHRPDRPPREQVLSEMQWLAALARETSLLIPEPVLNRRGELVTTLADGGTCRVMKWVPGVRRGRSMKLRHFELLGRLIARLHRHAEAFVPPKNFRRPQLGTEFVEQRCDDLRRAIDSGRLPRAYAKVFDAAEKRVFAAMRRLGRSREVYRLIHCDLGYCNHVFYRGEAGAIDFEACGFGYLLQDIAEPLAFVQHVKPFPAIRDALLRGYRKVAPLSAKHEKFLPDFLDAALLTTLGYIAAEPTRATDLRSLARYVTAVLRKRRS
jgi:Ser/Thr protein kinase RdoA (MazF antagonist)